MIKTENKGAGRWGLKPVIMAWIIPILLANFFLGVFLNYYMARENDSKRIEDHILQRRLDLIFLTNLTDLRMYFMDIKLELKEEAKFVKGGAEIYISNYLKNLKPPFPHVLSVVSLQGKEHIRIEDGKIMSEYRDFAGTPHMDLLTRQIQISTDLPLPALPESPLFKNSTLVDVLPIFDEIEKKVIGGIIYKYDVPVKLLTSHTRHVLIFNLVLGLSIASLALLVLYVALGNIIKPLNRLTMASKEILTGGDLTKEIEVKGWGETSLLATTFETMRQRLKSQFELLEDQTRKLGAIINFLPDATFVIDREGRVISWNRAMETMTGVKAEDILGKGDYAYAIPFYGDKRPILADLIFQPHEESRKSYGQIESRPDGTLIAEANILNLKGVELYLIGTSAPLYDHKGRIVGAIESLRDITDRKLMEEELRKSGELYTRLVDTIPDIIARTDLEGKILFVNNYTLLISGYTREEIEGQNILKFITSEDQSKAIQNISLMMEGRIDPREYRIIMKDGRKLLFEVNGDLLRNEDGTPFGLVYVCRNINDRKQAEEEKRILGERLQRAEKMEALGTMAGGVAHDLNNVLGVVVGYAELLLDKVDESSSIRDSLVNIMKGGERAAAIVQDLLTLARRGVPGKNVLNLNRIISDFQQSPEFKNLLSYHFSVQIKTDLEPGLLNISGSSVHLGKTIFNLVSNASEAMPNGGIITIKTTNEYLDKPIHGYDEVREGDYVVLSVSDTGEGIPAADLKRIFEPFYTKKVMGRSGTGLGLAVVWGTVKDHHGYINVQSEKGKGSTFTLYFPVTREDISSEHVAVSVSEYMGQGESILIVDDVKEQRDLAAEMLRKLNYRITSVSSGEEAVSYLKEHQADLMVLDMIMDPGMDGLDTYEKVFEIHPKQKAIIVSGFSETYRVTAAQGLGAGAYVKKPYVIEKLGLAVRKELDRK